MFTGSSDHDDFRPLSPEVSRLRAQARLKRKRRWFSFRSEPLRLELIHLPVYIVEARFSPPQTGDSIAVRLAVDGLNGSVERIDRSLTLESVVPDSTGEVPPPSMVPAAAPKKLAGTGSLPGIRPSLTGEEALSRARAELPWLSLHFALRRGVVYSLVDMDVSDRVGYPYWVLHTVRRQRRDFRALDGISGKRLGSRGRSLVVQGYILLAHGEGGQQPESPAEEN